MNLSLLAARARTRRHFLLDSAAGMGAIALASLLGRESQATSPGESASTNPLAVRKPHFAAKAKNVIYLHMSGAPPQQELFDYKPKLVELHMKPCPDELLKNQRFAFIVGHPKLLGCPFKFERHGKSGAWISELLPRFAEVVDEVAFLKGMNTDQFNHAPAELFLYTGSSRPGGAGMGAWVTYGLGSESQNLPGFVVLISGGTDPTGGKALWSTGYLPSLYQGVQCRAGADPVLYVSNPKGMDRDVRRRSLDTLRRLNELELQQFGDPETVTRINQYELAFRMQMAVPEVVDIGREPEKVRDLYGAVPGASSFANNCLLARRLVERGVRYVQLFDWGWDIHGTGTGDDIEHALPRKCKEVDRPIAALLKDLRQRGLLDSTLVVWGGEFGRTSMNEARGGSKYLGRDHHPHCFTIWMAGAGVKSGVTHGATDELGYFVTEGKVGIHDLQATILHLLGLDAWKLSYPYQGLNQRLIGPEGDARVVREVLA
jgi:acetyl esterase/lipase